MNICLKFFYFIENDNVKIVEEMFLNLKVKFYGILFY